MKLLRYHLFRSQKANLDSGNLHPGTTSLSYSRQMLCEISPQDSKILQLAYEFQDVFLQLLFSSLSIMP